MSTPPAGPKSRPRAYLRLAEAHKRFLGRKQLTGSN